MSNTLLWQNLESRVAEMVNEFPGVAGVCVKDLTRPGGFGINADEVFPTASTIKIHILTRLLQKAEAAELDLEEIVHVAPETYTPGSGVLAYLENGCHLTALNLAVLMIIVSDNTATNLCIDMAGIEDTNRMVRDLGLTATTLRRKMQDFDAVARNYENTSTPADCVAMLSSLHNGRPSQGVAQQCLDILRKPINSPLAKAIPEDVPLANKPGAMARVRNDAGIVFLPRRPYAIAVMSKFGVSEPSEQDQWVTDIATEVHDTMAVLDECSEFGQGIPR